MVRSEKIADTPGLLADDSIKLVREELLELVSGNFFLAWSTRRVVISVYIRRVILAALSHAGRAAAKLLPEDRAVAQRLTSAGLELLVWGGSLSLGCRRLVLGCVEANFCR